MEVLFKIVVMPILSTHLKTVVIVVATLISHLTFTSKFQYCVEVFPLEDGSPCSMAMMDHSNEAGKSCVSVESSNDCCVSKIINVTNQLVGSLKDVTKTSDTAPLCALSDFNTQLPESALPTPHVTTDRHSHSPPISQLIVQSTILLI